MVEGISVRVLIFEAGDADESILRELFLLLSERTDFQIMELPHKIESRSSPRQEDEQDVLTFPGLKINMREQTVYRNGELVPMSHYEFFTLCFLAKHSRWVFTKQQIYEAVWQEPEGDSNTAVTNIISQIRKKLNPDDPKNGYIKTVVNSGYKFDA